MTLFGTILKKVQSKDSIGKKYASPPPEIGEVVLPKKKKKCIDRYPHVGPRVDTSPPELDAREAFRKIAPWSNDLNSLYWENISLLCAIKRYHFTRGKVDCHWDEYPKPFLQFYEARKNFFARTMSDNKYLYKILMENKARVSTTASLRKDWVRNRRLMIEGATNKFVLFAPVPLEAMEDIAFKPSAGVKRPRIQLTLGVAGAASLGSMVVELFSEACPATCRLFQELAVGDGLGHGYVGTCFFTKVPGLYWAGGDVTRDNGFGCYAQRGRRVPIGAENYHFSHSMPGLLSMRMTANDEMCGCFNITFKPLPQFDLKNVVFGRVVRPCRTYDALQHLGSPLSTQPVVKVTAIRYLIGDRYVCGEPNTRLKPMRY